MLKRDSLARRCACLSVLLVIPLAIGLLGAGPALASQRAVLGELFSASG